MSLVLVTMFKNIQETEITHFVNDLLIFFNCSTVDVVNFCGCVDAALRSAMQLTKNNANAFMAVFRDFDRGGNNKTVGKEEEKTHAICAIYQRPLYWCA